MRKIAHLFFSLSITPENNGVMLHHQLLCHGRPSLVLEEPTVNDLVPVGSQCIYSLTPYVMMAEQKHCMLEFKS